MLGFKAFNALHGFITASSELSSGDPEGTPSSLSSLGAKCQFSYEELAAATDGFCKANLLGQGGFGVVHRGVLADQREVAVKSLKAGSGQGEREFRAEVEIISRVHHRHLVSLVGYCICREERMLVYEFVPNKTLEFHLHEKDQPVMEWAARRRIAVGSAKGLAYLHEDCHPRIIHRDIKAANILIDLNFEAMVADFGLAKLMSSDNNTHVSHVSTRVMGTFGYMAPEYAASGKLSEKSDVFSYGVVLLELITGRRPLDNAMGDSSSLVDWGRAVMRKALESEDYSEVGDPRLQGNYVPLEMARMVACAAACIRPSPSKRPRMSKILRALGGESTLEKVKSEGLQTRDESNSCNNYYTSSSYNTSEYNADLLKFREMVMSDDQDSNEFHPLTHQSSSSTNHLQSTPTSQHHQLHLPPPNTT